jgi:hypothetical protein
MHPPTHPQPHTYTRTNKKKPKTCPGTPYVEPPCAISDRKIPAGKHQLQVHQHGGQGPLLISHLIWF